MPSPNLPTHRFRPTKWRNHHGVRICECGSLKTDSVHRGPPVELDDRWLVEDARRIGERIQDGEEVD